MRAARAPLPPGLRGEERGKRAVVRARERGERDDRADAHQEHGPLRVPHVALRAEECRAHVARGQQQKKEGQLAIF